MLEGLGAAAFREAARAAGARAPDACLGRVRRRKDAVVEVLTDGGPVRATCGGEVLAAWAEDAGAAPVAGDWVVLRSWPDHRLTVHAVLERVNRVLLAGADPGSACANVDDLVLLRPAEPGSTGPDVIALRDLRERLAGGRTLAVLCPPGPGAAATRALLADVGGAPVLPAPGPGPTPGGPAGAPAPELVVVPGGGAWIDLTEVAGGQELLDVRLVR